MKMFPVKKLAVLIPSLCASFGAHEAISEPVKFDMSLLGGSVSANDLAYFENDLALPGTYRSNVTLNESPLVTTNVTIFYDDKGKQHTTIPARVLARFNWNEKNINPQLLQQLKALIEKDESIELETISDSITFVFDANSFALDLALPEAWLLGKTDDYVDPMFWDKGITAAFMDYDFLTMHSRSNGQHKTNYSSNIKTGFNIDGWYFRHNGRFNKEQDKQAHYTASQTYVQRDIPALKSRIILGQHGTKGDVFSSSSIIGGQIQSVESMLPYSQQSFAPVIKGNARTNAHVLIKQGDEVIYETTVAPGPFELNQVSPKGGGVWLNMVIEEADGSKQFIDIPYLLNSKLLAPGVSQYSIVVGKLDNHQLVDDHYLAELTYNRGINNLVSAFAGMQANQYYYALKGGLALNTLVGAFSFSVSQSDTNFVGVTQGGYHISGQNYELSYDKSFESTGSSISLSLNRYSTSGFMDFGIAMQNHENVKYGLSIDKVARPKSNVTLHLSQNLPEGWGNLFAMGYYQDYWNKNGDSKQFQVGYSNNIGNISYSFSASRLRDEFDVFDTRFNANISIPFDFFTFKRMSVNFDATPHGKSRETLTVSDSLGGRDQFNYTLSASHDNENRTSNAGIYTQYMTPVAELTATANFSDDYSKSYSFGVRGGAVVHSGGVTLTPNNNSQSKALIRAKGAMGALVKNTTNTKVDIFGYAVTDLSSNYKYFDVGIDPRDISPNTEILETNQRVAAYEGAIVRLDYPTKRGYSMLVNIDNSAIPFGNPFTNDKGEIIGYMGQGGTAVLQASTEKGQATVSMNNGKQCLISYNLDDSQSSLENGLPVLNARCE